MESTNMLIVVAVLAVLASAFGVVMSLTVLPGSTGYAASDASDIGNVTFEIESLIIVQFTNNIINWSTGYVNTSGISPCVGGGSFEAVLSTDIAAPGSFGSTIFCGVNWVPQTQGLTLESLSNQDINVTLTSDSNATTLIDGVGNNFNSNFRWVVSENETGSCNSAPNPAAYTEILIGQDVVVCDSMNFDQGSKAIDIDFEVNISEKAAQLGYQKAVITATAIRSDNQV